ncbi:MAG: SLBB domain-containing protein [Deltaproteobacteria bacterium]|nr:SLBB domain-containing protein [Deltaproteobacteria bacterium]
MRAYPQILFANRRPDRIASLEEYRAGGGYLALAEALTTLSPAEVEHRVLDAALLGRGGAGFPAARKWLTVAADAPRPRYLVCNADEMEPGTFKDRVLLHADPHLVLEGMALAAYSVGAERGILFIRKEYEGVARILDREIARAQRAGLLGPNILGSSFSFEVSVHRSGGRYICGEATAQLNAIEGKRPNPRSPPPYPTEKGLWGKPTVSHNVETLACVPHILRNGAEWFRSLAATPAGAGTKLYCVSGRVVRPGCFELPLGTPLREIVEEHAGGLPAGGAFKACLPGGASTRFLPRPLYDIAMDYDSLKAAGHRLGTGAIIVFDQGTCLVAATLNLIEFFARESCGWCTPCREGLPYVRDLLRRIEEGEGRDEFIPTLRRQCDHLNRAYCAFAPGAAAPVESLLTYFEEEVRAHVSGKGCPFRANRPAAPPPVSPGCSRPSPGGAR